MLIAAGLILFAIVCWLKREWGLYLIILLLPTYQLRFKVFGVPATFLEGMILILGAVEFIRLLKAGRWPNSRHGRPTFIFLGLFLLAAGASIFVSPVTAKAAGIFKAYFLEGVLFYFLILLIIDEEKKLKRLFSALAVLILYLAAFGIYQFLTLAHLPFSWWGVEVASRRIISVLNHPNALALLLGPILAMLIFWPRKTKLTWAALALGFVAFYLSFSRAAWLALAAALIIFGLLTTYKKKIIAGIILAALLILLIPFSRSILAELLRGNAPTQENRYMLWSAAADMLKKSPLLGVGLMGFHESYKNYPLGPDRVVQNYPHNFFLNFWLETSLLGLISITGLIILFYKKIFALRQTKSKRSPEPSAEGRLVSGPAPYALAAAAGMAVILLHGQVDVPYFKNDLAVLFWLIYALPNLKFLA